MKRYFYAEFLVGEMFLETKLYSDDVVKQKAEAFWNCEATRFMPVPYPPEGVNPLDIDNLE